MSNLTMTVDKLLRIPYQIDGERDVWKFYCPNCREWQESGSEIIVSSPFFS